MRLRRGSKGLSEGCTGLGLLTKLPLHCAMQKIRHGVMPRDPLVMFARLPMIAVLRDDTA
jgi:hypothetical protein